MATAVTVMDTVMVTDMVMATTVMDMATTVMDMVMVATDMGMVMEIGMGMGMGMGGMAVTAVGGRAAIGTTASAHAGC